jgi:glycosyltransferase involved in cell wall biosynthesis
LKIGAILPHLYLFGGVRRYIELSAPFISRGHDFIIYTPTADLPEWTALAGQCRPLPDASSMEHDVMITGTPEYVGLLRECRAALKVFYFQIEGVEGEREIVRDGDIMPMANSRGMMERMYDRYGVRPLDGRGGINPDLFHPLADWSECRRGKFRIMCYGRLSRPRKGTRFVIGAARSMYRAGYDIELVLFDSLTPGSSDPRVGFEPGLPFIYYINLPQERMAAMYASADVFVSAEHRAGWSNTCAEAAACGLPLVCTKSGTLDFAHDGRTAIVVSTRTSRSIRRALEQLYRDRSAAAVMGHEGAEGILEFTWEKVCDKMCQQFEGVIEDGRRAQE